MAMSGGTAKLVKTGYAEYGNTSLPIRLYVYYKTSQDVAKNQSTITVGMYVTTPSSSYGIGEWTDHNGSYVGTSSLTFDGTVPNFKGTRWIVENKQFTVSHDDDGKGKATIYWKWGVNSPWGQFVNPSGSFEIELPTIPRLSVPTLSATSATMGKTVTIYTNRKSTSFKHVLMYAFGTLTKETEFATSVGDSYIWTVPDLAKYCNNATSGTCTIYCHTYSGSTYLGTNSVTLTLNVPEASVPTLSASTIVIGNSLTIYTNRKSSNFTHVISYDFHGKKGTLSETATTSSSLSVDVAGFAGRIPNAKSGTGTITCVTKNGTATVGTKTVTFTATVPENSATKPSLSGLALTPSHSDEYPHLKNNFSDIYVQGLTEVKAAYTVSTPYSAFKSVTMTVKDSSGKVLSSVSGTNSEATSATINVHGSVKVIVTVTNTRGVSISSEKTISFYEYSKPEITLYGSNGKDSLLRCNDGGEVTESGLYLKIRAGRKNWSPLNGKNYCDLDYRCKVFDGLPFANEKWITLLDSNDSENEFDGIATIDGNPSSEKVELAARSSYLVEVRVNDTVGNQTVFTKTILTSEVTFFLDKGGKGASFGKYPEGDGLEVAWKSRFFGDVQGHVLGLSGLIPLSNGTDINKVTAHGAYSISSNDSAQTMLNLPLKEAGTLRVYSGDGKSKESGSWVYTIQEYINFRGRIRFVRFLWTAEDPGIWDNTEWFSLSGDEVGTSDIWTYIKRVDGTAECWARRNVTLDITGQWGQLYSGGISSISLPFTFIDPPVCTVTAEKGSTDHFFFCGSNGRATTTEAPSILVFRPASSTGVNVNVLYSVHGRWK